MLGMLKATEIEVCGSLPVLLKQPSFTEKEPLWVK